MIEISENPAFTSKICSDCKFFFKRYVIKNENYTTSHPTMDVAGFIPKT